MNKPRFSESRGGGDTQGRGNPQRSEAHMLRVAVVAEGKRVRGSGEPPESGAA
jgi:hypothetical protein